MDPELPRGPQDSTTEPRGVSAPGRCGGLLDRPDRHHHQVVVVVVVVVKKWTIFSRPKNNEKVRIGRPPGYRTVRNCVLYHLAKFCFLTFLTKKNIF